MFKRGEGPLVSVLLPTRGRVKWFRECIDSLHSLAKQPELIEYVIKVDVDDAASIEAARALQAMVPVRLMITPRGRGYMELNKYVGELAALARGDWLFIWNDDARMLTQDWDQVLLNCDLGTVPRFGGNEDVCLLAPSVIEREASWEFPILRRKAFQLLGRFSMTYSNDSWIYWILSGLDAAVILEDVKVTHFQNEIDDQIKREGRVFSEKFQDTLNTDEMRHLREVDRNILRAHMMGYSQRGY